MSVAEVKLLAKVEGERSYRMVVDQPRAGHRLHGHRAGCDRLGSPVSAGEWHLRVFFPKRRGLSETSDYANENGFRLDVAGIYGIDALEEVRHGLSEHSMTPSSRLLREDTSRFHVE